MTIAIIIVALFVVYGLLCLNAERQRKQNLAQREQARVRGHEAKIAFAKKACAEGILVTFDHGGSLIAPTRITEANDGVFYYLTANGADGGQRRASYEMVTDLVAAA